MGDPAGGCGVFLWVLGSRGLQEGLGCEAWLWVFVICVVWVEPYRQVEYVEHGLGLDVA